MFDFIDSGIMEGLQHRLLIMTEKRTMGQFKNSPGDTLTLQSQIIAKRTETDGKRKLLLRWHPENMYVHNHSFYYSYHPYNILF